ncbi:MAG: hypothetical protein ABJB12_19215 [Pseudomonadota bacterium]
MQLISDSPASCSPPEWLVSNGNVTVGPVGTELLLRGVLHGRVPDSSWVRQTGWVSWREVGKIREVSALKRVLARSLDPHTAPTSLREGREALAHAGDAGEVLLIALHAAAHATSATVGLAHRLREPLLLPTISCVFEAPGELLGEVLPWFDPAFALARSGALAFGRADAGVVERALGARLGLGQRLHSVAMLPIEVAGAMCAMLELGRSDHPFRESDAGELADFARDVGATLTRLSRASMSPTRGSRS